MTFISEAFDKPLAYVRDNEQESELKTILPAKVRYFEIYKATLGSDIIRFYLFLVNGDHYELHFLNSANEFEPMGILKIYAKNELTRIIATAIDIVTTKLKNKTTPVLVYGSDERKTDLFKKAIQSKLKNGIQIKDVKSVKGLDGTVYPSGFYVKQDTRTLKLEQIITKLMSKNKGNI
jgi:hypothetical protein